MLFVLIVERANMKQTVIYLSRNIAAVYSNSTTRPYNPIQSHSRQSISIVNICLISERMQISNLTLTTSNCRWYSRWVNLQISRISTSLFTNRIIAFVVLSLKFCSMWCLHYMRINSVIILRFLDPPSWTKYKTLQNFTDLWLMPQTNFTKLHFFSSNLMYISNRV